MYELRAIDVPAKGVSVLKNDKKVMEVLDVGATLNGLSLLKSDSIIDGYQKDELSTFAWSKSAILFPFPNRLRDGKFSFEGEDFQFPINDEVNHNALHGFVFSEKFVFSSSELTETECNLKFEFHYKGQYLYYPFPFSLQVEYKLTEDQLDVNFSIENMGMGNLPYGFGWHPYFVLSNSIDKVKIQLPEMEQMLLDQRQLPTGESRLFDDYLQLKEINNASFDTGFRVNSRDHSTIIQNQEGFEISLHAKNQPYLQIFTPEDRARIAIEPMSSGIDVFNSKEGFSTLAPSEKVDFKTSIKARLI